MQRVDAGGMCSVIRRMGSVSGEYIGDGIVDSCDNTGVMVGGDVELRDDFGV